MDEIRFVGIGKTRGYPYLVCKKRKSALGAFDPRALHVTHNYVHVLYPLRTNLKGISFSRFYLPL